MFTNLNNIINVKKLRIGQVVEIRDDYPIFTRVNLHGVKSNKPIYKLFSIIKVHSTKTGKCFDDMLRIDGFVQDETFLNVRITVPFGVPTLFMKDLFKDNMYFEWDFDKKGYLEFYIDC